MIAVPTHPDIFVVSPQPRTGDTGASSSSGSSSSSSGGSQVPAQTPTSSQVQDPAVATLLGLIAAQDAGAGIGGPADARVTDPTITNQAAAPSSSSSRSALAFVFVIGVAAYFYYRHKAKQQERAA